MIRQSARANRMFEPANYAGSSLPRAKASRRYNMEIKRKIHKIRQDKMPDSAKCPSQQNARTGTLPRLKHSASPSIPPVQYLRCINKLALQAWTGLTQSVPYKLRWTITRLQQTKCNIRQSRMPEPAKCLSQQNMPAQAPTGPSIPLRQVLRCTYQIQFQQKYKIRSIGYDKMYDPAKCPSQQNA